MFVVSVKIGMNEWKLLCGVFTFWVSNTKYNLDIGQKPYQVSLLFFNLDNKHWISQSFVNVFSQKRCSWKWLPVKLPAVNEWNCR